MMMTATAPAMASLDDLRLDAVLTRDRAFDGQFVYAVNSTGIYCRPSCPSRRPHPERVRFFTASTDAEGAGYRPCRRCHPDQPVDLQARRIADVCAYIRTHLTARLTLAALSRRAGMSPHHFQRTFVRDVGVSPREYADACRMRRLRTQLRNGHRVTSAMHDAGYGSSSRLYERAAASLGMTPATYGKGGAGATLRYAIGDSPFGRVLVAATDRGVAAVKIGPDDGRLVRALREEFHAAVITCDEEGLRRYVQAVVESTEGPAPDLPLDVRATAFQWRVWRALRAIPLGSTRSYKDVARAIGQPLAVRAVARACATNPVALVIPCHRVVPTSGSSGGYRWGASVKNRILELEQARMGFQPPNRGTVQIAAAKNDEPRKGRAGRVTALSRRERVARAAAPGGGAPGAVKKVGPHASGVEDARVPSRRTQSGPQRSLKPTAS